MHKLRQKASGRRVRYQSEGGYDLDLSCILFSYHSTCVFLLLWHYFFFYILDITDRIIAMPIPSEQKLTFKNSIADVVR